MAIRSEYIKNLMSSTKSLDNQFSEAVKESMKNIIGESAKKEIRQLLKEADDEDSYEEEDVIDGDTDVVKDDEVVDGNEIEDTEEVVDGGETEGGEEETEIWDDLENCKGADGEYDCTGMDNDKLMQVLKSMGPDDEVRIVSNGDGTATVEVDSDSVDSEEEDEFVIDLDGFEDDDIFDEEAPEEDEEEFELTFDDEGEDNEEDIEECGLNEGNLGYTDDYQKDTAMTTPSNHEPGSKMSRSDKFDQALPQGTEKPWAQDGDKQPYDKTVNEGEEEVKAGGPAPMTPPPGGTNEKPEALFEVELDEGGHTVTHNNPVVRGVGTTHKPNSSSQKYARNGHVEAQSPTNMPNGRGTGDGYKEASNESKDFKQKMNALYRENKQMKSIIPELQKRVEESIVINASMGYIVKLLNENTTTVDEKKQISKRFGEVTSLDECKKLYETISNELKTVNKSNDLNEKFNGQLAEGKQRGLIEKTMYKSDAVNGTLAFMKRLDAIK